MGHYRVSSHPQNHYQANDDDPFCFPANPIFGAVLFTKLLCPEGMLDFPHSFIEHLQAYLRVG
jgi:hypothetical protein